MLISTVFPIMSLYHDSIVTVAMSSICPKMLLLMQANSYMRSTSNQPTYACTSLILFKAQFLFFKYIFSKGLCHYRTLSLVFSDPFEVY